MIDYYKVLNIRRDASSNEIKKAYREAAIFWHPDKNKNRNAHEKFILINEAYSILIDSNRRIVYNKLYSDYFEDNTINLREKKEYEMYSIWIKESKIKAENIMIKSIDNVFVESFHFLDKYGWLLFWLFIGVFLIIMRIIMNN